MAIKYTKWPQNIPYGSKIDKMATKFTKWPQNVPIVSKIDNIKFTNIILCKTLPNFTQIGIFGLKTEPSGSTVPDVHR
jgi:hypothetical protein